jgi:hypothetical protein
METQSTEQYIIQRNAIVYYVYDVVCTKTNKTVAQAIGRPRAEDAMQKLIAKSAK